MRFSDALYHPTFAIIDTHCHYNLEPIWPDWRAHWKKAQEHNVTVTWIPGTSIATSRRALEIAQANDDLFAFVGIHPGAVGDEEVDLELSLRALEQLLNQAQAAKPAMGIGEIGLDYYHTDPADENLCSEQRIWFRRQIELALAKNLPVILHVRDRETPEEPTAGNAYWDALRIVTELGMPKELTLHCASGPLSYIREFLALGAYVGFDGNITYPNAAAIREIWRTVPPNRRLLETDAPYLPPQSHRGKTCEPWMIAETREYCSNLE